MNVVVDTLDEVLDEESKKHDVVVVEIELYFIPIHRNIINYEAENCLVWK